MWNPCNGWSANGETVGDKTSERLPKVDKVRQLGLENIKVLVVTDTEGRTRYYITRPGLRKKNFTKRFLLSGYSEEELLSNGKDAGCSIEYVPMKHYITSEEKFFYEEYLDRKKYFVCLKILSGIQKHLNELRSEYEAALTGDGSESELVKTKTIGQKKRR